MPKKYTNKKTYKKKPYKKNYKKKYYKKYNKLSILTCPSAIPDKMRVKMSFATSGSWIITGISSQQTIVATQNNPFGTAVQPQAWDQWANMYLKWRPLAMAIKTRTGVLDNNSLNPGTNLRAWWSQYASAPGSDLAIIQNRFTKIKELTNQTGWITIKTYSKLHNVHGLTRKQWYNNENTSADVTSSPVTVTRYYINWNCPYWTTGNNFTIGYEIIGDMWVEFFSPRILVDA